MNLREQIDANFAKVTTPEQATSAFAFMTGAIIAQVEGNALPPTPERLVAMHAHAVRFAVSAYPARRKEGGNE